MPEAPEVIAERAMPGWKAVKIGGQAVHHGTDGSSPTLAVFKRKYGISPKGAATGLAHASTAEGETEVVVLNPPAGMAELGQKLVVVSQGKVVLVQG